jgi:hypothetical protein
MGVPGVGWKYGAYTRDCAVCLLSQTLSIVTDGTGNPYAFPNLTAGYITKWVEGAQSVYNLSIDYVGIWNEVLACWLFCAVVTCSSHLLVLCDSARTTSHTLRHCATRWMLLGLRTPRLWHTMRRGTLPATF